MNAFISVTDESGNGTLVAVKDLIRVRGTVTTGGGVILPRAPDAEDAPVISEVRKAGCLIVGKTNLHEWAYGPTSVNPHYGPVRNPHDPSRISGGSSGGSAVAVATGMCDWAIGTDTGGSIRIPSALCGVAGMKPTIGTVSTEGVLPLSRSLDTIGPIGLDVRTLALGLASMGLTRGPESKGASLDIGAYRLGIPADWVDGLDETVRIAWSNIASNFSAAAFPDRARMATVARTIVEVEASAFHRAWLMEDASRYGSDVRALLESGLTISGVDYVHAKEEIGRLRNEAEHAMRDLDALIVPTTAITAPMIDEPDLREALTRFTRPFNATGQPVVSLPVRSTGLPVGIQLVGHLGKDWALIDVAYAAERAWSSDANIVEPELPTMSDV
jgi:aspartyl-tRNA(Asn)/glutamyl-tRNA(Gln) amidotransferase subunit A